MVGNKQKVLSNRLSDGRRQKGISFLMSYLLLRPSGLSSLPGVLFTLHRRKLLGRRLSASAAQLYCSLILLRHRVRFTPVRTTAQRFFMFMLDNAHRCAYYQDETG
jgi:hypothetical protein